MSDTTTPAASTISRDSWVVKRRSAARISVSSPSSRRRCSPSRRSWRVASTNRRVTGARISRSSSCRSSSSLRTSCRSSITSQVRSSRCPSSASKRSTIAQPSRSGAAVRALTTFEPVVVTRSASATEIQNRCGSRCSGPTATQAARSARPESSIQERSKIVFPLPAGAERLTTRPASPSRSKSSRRETMPRRTAGATGPSVESDRTVDCTAS